jgi:hypothetical protein
MVAVKKGKELTVFQPSRKRAEHIDMNEAAQEMGPSAAFDLATGDLPDTLADLQKAFTILDVKGEAGAWRARLQPKDGRLRDALDEVVFGGPLVVALPVDDEAAFRASLERSPVIRLEHGDTWVISFAADYPALKALRVLRGMTSSNSPAEMFAAARGEQSVEWTVQLIVADGRAVLAPSFEAGIVAQRVFDEVPGFSIADGPVVLCFDAQRFHLAYQEELRGAVNTVRGLLLGVQMAGIASMFSGMMSASDEAEAQRLPIPGPAIWALLEMLSMKEIDGVQLTLHGMDGGELLRALPRALEGAEEAGGSTFDGTSTSLDVRMVWAEGSPPERMLAGFRPVTEIPGAAVLGFDPGLFPAALAEWARPLVEYSMGEGQPAERLMSHIAALLAPCDGTLIAGLEPGTRALALSVRPGAELDVEGMGEVLELFAHTLDLEPDGEGLTPWDGVTSPEGMVPAGRYWQSEDTFFMTGGPCTELALDQLAVFSEEAAGGTRGSAGAPFLALSTGELAVRMYAEQGELLLELPLLSGFGQ